MDDHRLADRGPPQGKRIHCVGIGGIGISAIARVLLDRGYQVTGSDLSLSAPAKALAESGAVVYVGHNASHLGDVDAVLISSAIPDANPEVAEAKRRGIPVYKRAEFLGSPMADLMADKVGIAVAGTHGKTTTASMLAWALTRAGCDPSFVVGGIVQGLGTNAQAGRGPHFVIEADEYDRMFLGLRPTVAAITHLEHDHPDCYPTFADMQAAFEQFVDRVPADGLVVGCADQPAVAALLSRRRTGVTIQTCGLGDRHDWRASDVRVNSVGGHDFRVSRTTHSTSERAVWGDVRLQVPGVHNVQNALVALVVLDWLDIDRETVRHALSSFPGVGRRFETQGQVNGRTVVDDYGHHPTEIRATLAAARARYGARPLWAVFQPHTYSRLKALWGDFQSCFALADHVIVLDVYAARETDTLGLSAADLVEQMEHRDTRYVAAIANAADYIVDHAEPDAVVITLSAGDGNQVGKQVLNRLAG
jgi:UDP-N-acetylmuramate--alanine ligase